MISKFNGTSTPKGSCRAKTGDNDCNVNSSRYSLRIALCKSIRYQAKSEQNVRITKRTTTITLMIMVRITIRKRTRRRRKRRRRRRRRRTTTTTTTIRT